MHDILNRKNANYISFYVIYYTLIFCFLAYLKARILKKNFLNFIFLYCHVSVKHVINEERDVNVFICTTMCVYHQSLPEVGPIQIQNIY